MKRNPLAGTGKVFGFSIKQTCTSKGWLISTILIAALLLIGIPLLFLAITSALTDDNTKDESKRIQTVFVVDETEGTADYSVLAEDLTFTAYDSMEQALANAEKGAQTIVLNVTKPEKTYILTAYLPENTAVSRSRAGRFTIRAISSAVSQCPFRASRALDFQ